NKLVIFDISNTYFEGVKSGSKLADFGRSKEKRTDCRLVVFTGVINAAGFIRHSRIYEGNKADSGTLEDMLNDLKRNFPLFRFNSFFISLYWQRLWFIIAPKKCYLQISGQL